MTARATIDRLARLAGAHAWPALAVALAITVELGLVLNPAAPSVFDVVCALIGALSLAFARRHALAVVFAVQAALIVGVALGERTHDGLLALAVFPATYAAGRHVADGLATLGLAASLVGSAVALALGPDTVASDYPIVLALFGLAPWAAGRAVRVRHRQASALRDLTAELEREQDSRARAAAAGERTRIARELHDVISHSVSLIAVQAGAAGRVIDTQPSAARDALGTIERTAREALGELRRLLGIMREHDPGAELAPPPGLHRLDQLVEQTRTADLLVDLRIEGKKRPLSPGVDLTAYRIVQEALTNARRHAGPAKARVTVRYTPHELQLEIVDDGRGPAASNGQGAGLGLIGMRERVALYGGRLATGARDTGGYRVHAVVPLEPS